MRQLTNQEQHQISGGLTGLEIFASTLCFSLVGLGVDSFFNTDQQQPYLYTSFGMVVGFIMPLAMQI